MKHLSSHLSVCALLVQIAAISLSAAESSTLWDRVAENAKTSGYRIPAKIHYREVVRDGTGKVTGNLTLDCNMKIESGALVLNTYEIIEGEDMLDEKKIEWIRLLMEHTGIDTPYFMSDSYEILHQSRQDTMKIRGIECEGIDFSYGVEDGKVYGTVWVHPETELPVRIDSRFVHNVPIEMNGDDLEHFNRSVNFSGNGDNWRPTEGVQSGWFSRRTMFSRKLKVHNIKLTFSDHELVDVK